MLSTSARRWQPFDDGSLAGAGAADVDLVPALHCRSGQCRASRVRNVSPLGSVSPLGRLRVTLCHPFPPCLNLLTIIDVMADQGVEKGLRRCRGGL